MLEFPFPHHNYQQRLDEGEYEFISADQATGVEDLAAVDIANAAQTLRDANVRQLMVIHGTFAGNDILGLMRELNRVLPDAADALKSLSKSLFDQVAGEVGNYTEQFASKLAEIINRDGGQDQIVVTRFSWSGENHHLGRAGGALALLDQLLSTRWKPDERLMVWAHSHGGNLLALLTNLVGSSPNAVQTFFTATHSHYSDPVLERLDLPLWERMRKALLAGDIQERLPAVDIATFGTPLRYRWNRTVCPHLLHFVQHRSLDADNPIKACLPTSMEDLSTAAGGDYAQQFGIGGTDFPHSVWAWCSWTSERRLRRMLEPGVRRIDLAKNLQRGHRVSLDGKTLLVDYPDQPGKWNQQLLGHGIYTRHEWIPFHLQQIAKRMHS